MRINHPVSRRVILGAAIAAPVAAHAGPAPADLLLDRAIKARGGKALVKRVTALEWQGRAEVFVDDKPLALAVKTRVRPFGAVHAEYDVATGQPEKRVFEMGPGGNFLTREDKRETMPAGMAAHEREQFGLYGYLLLALAPTRSQDGKLLIAEKPDYPRCVFHCDRNGVIRSAEYNVIRYDGQGALGQWFEFEGVVTDKGLRWPKKMTIHQAGKIFFTQTIDTFSVTLA